MGQKNGVSNTVIDTPGRSNFIETGRVTKASQKDGSKRERQEMNIVHIKLGDEASLGFSSIILGIDSVNGENISSS